jgi:hypothetical protein
MKMSDDATDTPAAVPVDNPPVLNRLTRAQVFARDPEETTQEDIDFIVAELRKINERNRKARKDDEAIAEGTAKLKKANAATRKKKGAAPLPADLLDAKL